MNLPVWYIAITPHTLARILTRNESTEDANIIYLSYVIDVSSLNPTGKQSQGCTARQTKEACKRRMDGDSMVYSHCHHLIAIIVNDNDIYFWL